MNLKQFYSLNFLGRFLLSAIFINAIPFKILEFRGQTDFIMSKGFPEPIAQLLLIAAIGLLIIGSFLLLFTKKIKLGSSLLLIFLIPTTVIFHLITFQPLYLVSNITYIGGLLLAIDKAS